MGGKLAVFGAMLFITFPPICQLPWLGGDKDWQSSPNGSNIAQAWPKKLWVGSLHADFRQIFEIPESVVSARLRLLADSAIVIVQINDQLVSEAQSNGQIIDIDVTSFLQKGENLVWFTAVAEDRFPQLKLDWTDNKGNGGALVTDWKATIGEIAKESCWTIYVGFLLWAVFRYLQYAFSEKK